MFKIKVMIKVITGMARELKKCMTLDEEYPSQETEEKIMQNFRIEKR